MDFDIEIYNRWGGLIYKTNDVNFRWCGEKSRVSDVYVYKIRLKNNEGKTLIFKGNITVL